MCWDRPALAALALVVFAAYAAGDAVAEEIVGQASQSLAETASAVVRTLGWKNEPVPLALAGGALLAHPRFRQRVEEALRSTGVNPAPVVLVDEPARGAVHLAHRLSLRR